MKTHLKLCRVLAVHGVCCERLFAMQQALLCAQAEPPCCTTAKARSFSANASQPGEAHMTELHAT